LTTDIICLLVSNKQWECLCTIIMYLYSTMYPGFFVCNMYSYFGNKKLLCVD